MVRTGVVKTFRLAGSTVTIILRAAFIVVGNNVCESFTVIVIGNGAEAAVIIIDVINQGKCFYTGQ